MIATLTHDLKSTDDPLIDYRYRQDGHGIACKTRYRNFRRRVLGITTGIRSIYEAAGTAQIQYLPIRTTSLGYVRTVINNSTCNFPVASIHSSRFIIEPCVSQSCFVTLFANRTNHAKLLRDDRSIRFRRCVKRYSRVACDESYYFNRINGTTWSNFWNLFDQPFFHAVSSIGTKLLRFRWQTERAATNWFAFPPVVRV